MNSKRPLNALKYITFLFFLSLITQTGDSHAAEPEVGMVTGGRTGTYIRIGQDIASLAKSKGVNIVVKESKGSLANIKRMMSKENAAFGIVQSDVLSFLARSHLPEQRKAAHNLRVVLPLYNEEVHVFANKRIRSLKDLEGKRISVGPEEGGSWLTAVTMLKILGITPSRIETLSNFDAAHGVLTGNLDAMFYVAGKPVSFFVKLGTLKDDPALKGRFENVHFVEISDPRILEEYVPSEIGPSDYAWVGKSTPTVAVKAMMVSFDFSSRKNAYYQQRCKQLAAIGQTIRSNIADLRSGNFTPKWQEVNLDIDVGTWKRDSCSRSAIVGTMEGTIEKILASPSPSPATPSEPETSTRSDSDRRASAPIMPAQPTKVAPPVLMKDSAEMNQGTSITIDVIANDTAPPGQELALRAVTQPFNGKAEITEDGQIKYTPNAEFFGHDGFKYHAGSANAQRGDTAVQEVSIHVKKEEPNKYADQTFDGQDLTGVDFSGKNLTGTSFKRATLVGTNFTGARLSGADFSSAKAQQAIFSSAALDNATFIDTDLTRANFNGANLAGASLKGATLSYAEVKEANLDDANLRHTNLDHTDFSGSSLKDVKWFSADINKTVLKGVKNFDKAHFKEKAFYSYRAITDSYNLIHKLFTD